MFKDFEFDRDANVFFLVLCLKFVDWSNHWMHKKLYLTNNDSTVVYKLDFLFNKYANYIHN